MTNIRETIEADIRTTLTAVEIVKNTLTEQEAYALDDYYNEITKGLIAAGTDGSSPEMRQAIINRAAQLQPAGAIISQRVISTAIMINSGKNSNQKLPL